MSVVINGVTCEEIVRDFGEGIDSRGPEARKGYLCAWADRYAVANGALGLVSVSGGVGGAVTLPVPETYAESSNLYAMDVHIEPKGTPSQGPKQIAFPYAIVWVNYGVPRFGVTPRDDPGNMQAIDPATPFIYASQEISFSIEQYTIPASAIKLVGGGVADKDVTTIFPRADLSITLHRVPYLPAQKIFSLTGKINDAKFLGADVGQVIFNGATSRRTASTDGTFTQEITYSFSYRTVASWDKIFHPNGTGGWVRFTDRNDNPLISSADLTKLFPVGYTY